MIRTNSRIVFLAIAVTLGVMNILSAQEEARVLTHSQKRARNRERNLAVRARLQKPCGVTSDEQEMTLDTLREMISHEAGVYMFIEESAEGIDAPFMLPPITPETTFEHLLDLAVDALSKPPKVLIDWTVRNQSVFVANLEGIHRVLNGATIEVDIAILDVTLEKMNELGIKVGDFDKSEEKDAALKKLSDLANGVKITDGVEIHANTRLTCNFDEEISFMNAKRVSYTTDEMYRGKEEKTLRYNDIGVDLRITPQIVDFKRLTLQISLKDNYPASNPAIVESEAKTAIPSAMRIELNQRLDILNGETVVLRNLQAGANRKSYWIAVVAAKIDGIE